MRPASSSIFLYYILNYALFYRLLRHAETFFLLMRTTSSFSFKMWPSTWFEFETPAVQQFNSKNSNCKMIQLFLYFTKIQVQRSPLARRIRASDSRRVYWIANALRSIRWVGRSMADLYTHTPPDRVGPDPADSVRLRDSRTGREWSTFGEKQFCLYRTLSLARA